MNRKTILSLVGVCVLAFVAIVVYAAADMNAIPAGDTRITQAENGCADCSKDCKKHEDCDENCQDCCENCNGNCEDCDARDGDCEGHGEDQGHKSGMCGGHRCGI